MNYNKKEIEEFIERLKKGIKIKEDIPESKSQEFLKKYGHL